VARAARSLFQPLFRPHRTFTFRFDIGLTDQYSIFGRALAAPHPIPQSYSFLWSRSMRRFHVWLAVGGLVALAGAPGLASAQGFSVNEHGTCAMGRAGTGVAAPCNDGSSMFMNPAGLTQLKAGQTQISVGATFIRPSGGFEADTAGRSRRSHLPDPALYLSHGWRRPREALGLRPMRPQHRGVKAEWPSPAASAPTGAEIRSICISRPWRARSRTG
jgi:hypothetical protein